MTDVTAIILAAGLSRRMGARNKLLLPVDGVPMIRHMVGIYTEVTQRSVVVVTGHAAQEVSAALKGSSAQIAFNPDYADGQQTSVACGLRAATGGSDVLIGLGDQPRLTPDDLRALLAGHTASDSTRISIPGNAERRGNPIVIPAALRPRLLADPKSPGCKTFTRKHSDLVQFHPLQAPGFFADIDTPEDYQIMLDATREETP